MKNPFEVMRITQNTSNHNAGKIGNMVLDVAKKMDVSVQGMALRIRSTTKDHVHGRYWFVSDTADPYTGRHMRVNGEMLLRLPKPGDVDEYEITAIIAHELSHHKDHMEYVRKGKKIPRNQEKRANAWAETVVRDIYGDVAAKEIRKWEEYRLERQRRRRGA